MSEVRLIDANALMKKIEASYDLFEGCEYIGDKARRDELSSVMARIINAPTIKPTVDKDYLIRLIQEAVYDGEACARLMDMVEPKQGRWRCGDMGYGSYDFYVCSECGEEISDMPDIQYRFCPWCGAKMTTEESSIVERSE